MSGMKSEVIDRFNAEFGAPSREVVKVKSWDLSNKIGVVVQLDGPTREDAAYVWLPYPSEGQQVPDIALEYPGEAGRHNGTYATAGLKRGEPALKLTIRTSGELNDLVGYIRAMLSNTPLPAIKSSNEPQPVIDGGAEVAGPTPVDVTCMPIVEPMKPRRQAIPRAVQREVWQRDGGRCVECSTREQLCFDHIVPFSRGGSNSVRNLQLLCERCNLSKSNHI